MCIFNMRNIYCFVAPNVATISFTQSTYSFKEDSNVVQPVLVLSNPLTTDIIIEVVDREDTATGEFRLYFTYQLCIYCIL